MYGRAFSHEDLVILSYEWRAGTPLEEISKKLKRHPKTVENKRKAIGLPCRPSVAQKLRYATRYPDAGYSAEEDAFIVAAWRNGADRKTISIEFEKQFKRVKSDRQIGRRVDALRPLYELPKRSGAGGRRVRRDVAPPPVVEIPKAVTDLRFHGYIVAPRGDAWLVNREHVWTLAEIEARLAQIRQRRAA